MERTLELAKQLILKKSITPKDEGCQEIIIKRLEKIGFKITKLRFGEVDNFWAIRDNGGKVFTFAGHTDVVPVGDEKAWNTDAFTPTIKDGMLYGRGAADMKSSIAAMLVATEDFVNDNPNHNGAISFLITADEEGVATDGTVKVVEYLQENSQKIDYCLVGEPSSSKKLGDIIKNGRRGSLNANLTIIGKQGHIAYPHLAANPIHLSSPAINELCNEAWDNGNQDFPATSFQISNINSGTGATNVTPSKAQIIFNFRYSTETTKDELQQRVLAILDKHKLKYEITWKHSGAPFLTTKKDLINACVKAIKSVNNVDTQLSTSGGISDGRFIAPTGAQVVEFGPLNNTIHQVNECVCVKDLGNLTKTYYQILKNITK